MASNATVLQDSAGAYPDWIELYNPTGEDVDLADWTITDNLEKTDKSVLPSLTIEAGGFLILYADDDQEDGDEHVNFSLSADGEEIDVGAIGELTIRGVTRTETIPLTAERVGDVIVVFGQLGPILLADYDIEEPTAAVVLSVEDNAIMELQVFFRRA